ncbi:MAG: hypothetical protein JXR58_07270 [Bacteroidales bacterium]|nr:hypothetical protein [Bacteroidales bacterium]
MKSDKSDATINAAHLFLNFVEMDNKKNEIAIVDEIFNEFEMMEINGGFSSKDASKVVCPKDCTIKLCNIEIKWVCTEPAKDSLCGGAKDSIC